MKTSDLVSNSSLGQMTPDDVLGLVQDRLASSRTGLMHVRMHKQLLERAVAAERARCLEIVEKVCAKAAETQGDRAEEALFVSSRERHIYGRRLVLLLVEEITKQIKGDSNG